MSDRLLATAVRLLPAHRREWGTAMRADLAALTDRRQRRLFTLGCLRVIGTRPAVWRRLAFPVLLLAVLAGAVRWTAQVGYSPLRWGLLGLVGVLLLLTGLGRVRPLGPVGDNLPARGVRATGFLLIGAFAVEVVASAIRKDQHDVGGAPILTVLLGGYLLGFLTLTARRTAATGRTLLVGALTGVAIAAAWTGAVLLFPPIPPGITLALALIAPGMALAALIADWRAAICAGVVAALLILHTLLLLSTFGPARLIPDLVPAALTPADDLANSRIEIQDPYVLLLLVGSLIAFAHVIGWKIAPPGRVRRRSPTTHTRPAE